MKYLLLIVLIFSFLSCENYAPNDMAYVIELYNGEIIVVKNYNIEPGGFTVKYHASEKSPSKIHKVVEYKPNLLYEAGYKQGQIDAENGNICFVRITTNDGEVLWKDTCTVKRKIKLD